MIFFNDSTLHIDETNQWCLNHLFQNCSATFCLVKISSFKTFKLTILLLIYSRK